ncbi:MAG: helix-turn-helix domain-containing protein [Gemmatimonadaceae bacterium]
MHVDSVTTTASLDTPAAASALPRLATPRVALAAVTTVLTPAERLRVDAAGEGLYRAIHRDTVEDVIRDLKERRAGAVLVSVARCCDAQATSRMATVVREFPRVPAVALLTQFESESARTVLALGRCGVSQLVDVRQPTGWRELRAALMTDRGDEIRRFALGQLAVDLAGAPEDCWRFFESLFGGGTTVSTVRALARELSVLPSTLMSRFFRAGLPAPKCYLAFARLVRAARLFENHGLSIANVANHLDYSSPQSFGRHVRTLIGMTALEFRRRYDGEGMLYYFREQLVLPYVTILRRFHPLIAQPGWLATSAGRGDSDISPRLAR